MLNYQGMESSLESKIFLVYMKMMIKVNQSKPKQQVLIIRQTNQPDHAELQRNQREANYHPQRRTL